MAARKSSTLAARPASGTVSRMTSLEKGAAAKSAVLVLPPLNLQEMEVAIIGETPLIVHAWSVKAKKEMLAKQMKQATDAKEAKNPEQDFQDSLYRFEGEKDVYGFPSVGIKACMVTAVTSVSGVTKVAARQAFRVVGEQALVRGAFKSLVMRQDLVRIYGPKPEMREDMVRIGMGTADIRYRGQFWPWGMIFKIGFNANVVSAEQLLHLLNLAGFGVGLGEWRSEKDGTSGAFRVVREEDQDWLDEQRKITTSAKKRVSHG